MVSGVVVGGVGEGADSAFVSGMCRVISASCVAALLSMKKKEKKKREKFRPNNYFSKKSENI